MKLFSGKGWVRSTSPFDFKSFFTDLFDSFEATNEIEATIGNGAEN